jgi:hypothetical protein
MDDMRATTGAKDRLQEIQNVGVTSATASVIRNVGVLDLSGLDSPDVLDGITSMVNVGVVIVPEPLLPKLSRIPMRNVGVTIPVPKGARLRQFSGQTVLSGDALANPDGSMDDVLLVSGQLAITSPVQKVGFGQIMASGQVLAPVGSETVLSPAFSRMSGQVSYYPYTEGAVVRVQIGSQRMSGKALANPGGQPTDILLVIGSLIATSPVEQLGYQHLAVIGTVLAPAESEDALEGRVTSLGGGVIYYTAPPRVFDGKDTFGPAFFEYLDEPITMVLTGRFTIDDDVSVDLVKQKVAAVVLTGKLTAPRDVVSLIQARTLTKTGVIRVSGSDDAADRD